MPNTISDPIMGLTIPVAGSDPGPEYAEDISNDLSRIAAHTHTGASNQDGYQIPAAGLNIDADVSAQSHNLTALRSTRYTPQGSPLAGSGDKGAIYVSGNDLYYNDTNGTPVRITSGGAVDVTVSNNYTPKTVNTNYTINSSDGYSVFLIDTTAARTITLPLASNAGSGRFYIFKDATGTASVNHILLNHSSSDLIDGYNSYSILPNWGAVQLVSNGVSSWEVFKYDQNYYSLDDSLTFGSGGSFKDANAPNLNINNGANVNFALGSALNINANTTVSINTEVDYKGSALIVMDSGAEQRYESGSLLSLQSGSHVDGYVTFKSTSHPSISQDTTSANAGQDLSISAQPTSFASSIGGNVTLTSGTGTSTTLSSAVKLQPAGTSGATLLVYPPQGTAGSQRQINAVYNCVITTSNSGSPLNFLNLHLENNAGANVKVNWIRRQSGAGGGCLGNEALNIISSNGAGTLSYGSFTEFVTPAGAFDTFATAFTITDSANTLKFAANQIAADDWQIIVTVNYS